MQLWHASIRYRDNMTWLITSPHFSEVQRCLGNVYWCCTGSGGCLLSYYQSTHHWKYWCSAQHQTLQKHIEQNMFLFSTFFYYYYFEHKDKQKRKQDEYYLHTLVATVTFLLWWCSPLFHPIFPISVARGSRVTKEAVAHNFRYEQEVIWATRVGQNEISKTQVSK